MRRLRFLIVASFFIGCSLMTKYDQDGQPCDPKEPNLTLSCLSDAGYVCVGGFCKKGALPPEDAGFKDAGPTDGGKDGGNLGG